MKTPAAFSTRDKRLMIGFGLFLEVVLCYMLLIDGSLNKISTLEGQVAKARTALKTLEESAALRATEAERAERLPGPLTLEPGESTSLVLQNVMDTLSRKSGTTLVGTSLLKQEGDTCQIDVKLEGSYEAISGFTRMLVTPPFLMGIETLSVRPTEAQPDRLFAEVVLSVPTQQ